MAPPSLNWCPTMSTVSALPEPPTGFTPEQKEYLAGFLAGVAQLNLASRVGAPAEIASQEATIFGARLADVTKQECWKHEEHPLDGWDRILAHAEANKFPDEENTYRF